MGIRSFIDSLFSSGDTVKRYYNAELYNLLGKDYEKVLEYGIGREWTYSDVNINLVFKVNAHLELKGTVDEFKKDDTLENNLLKLRTFYQEHLKKVELDTEIERKERVGEYISEKSEKDDMGERDGKSNKGTKKDKK